LPTVETLARAVEEMIGKGIFFFNLGKFKGDNFRSELKLPLYLLRRSSSSTAHMEPFLKIPNRDLLAKLVTLLT